MHLLLAGHLILGGHEELVALHRQDMGRLLGGRLCGVDGRVGIVDLKIAKVLLLVMMVVLVLAQVGIQVLLGMHVEGEVRVAALHVVGWYIRQTHCNGYYFNFLGNRAKLN